jgi:hypothetical protein
MENNTKKDHLSEEKSKIEIEINKYKRLVDILNNPKMLAKSIVVLSVIIVLVFIGVSAIALTIKRFYPYKAVETNKYGATVIKNEDTEVTYWLFNSADLWANSGIEVKKGQIITVRTSGAFHTAIHHLVDDAKKNQQRDKWLNATGGMQSTNPQDKARSQYKIAPEYDFNTIIMQVIPQDVLNMGDDWYKKINENANSDTIPYLDYIDGMNMSKRLSTYIYKIGDGYENIEIQNDGILCFACNDIALTKRNIKKIKGATEIRKDSINVSYYKFSVQDIDVKSIKNGYITIDKNMYRIIELTQDSLKVAKDSIVITNRLKDFSSLNIGSSPIATDSSELDYYYRKNFVDAWFVDNVGSFLIVVECKK